MTKLSISFEQGTFEKQFIATFNHIPTLNEVANIVLNEAYSYMAIQKMMVSQKNRPSLAKPFVFSIAVEQDNKDLLISDFESKLTFSDKGIEKLVRNFPTVLAELLISKEMPVMERRTMLNNAKELQLTISE